MMSIKHQVRSFWRMGGWCSLWVAATAGPAGAVIIKGGDGSGNTTAASIGQELSDFIFWANVGSQGSGSGVYLGNHWVLTAYHINGTGQPGGVRLGGTFYGRDTQTPPVHLMNPDGSTADLRLFRITQAPESAPAVTIATSSPAIGTDVVMIGDGRNREAGLTGWSLSASGDDSIWTEIGPPDGTEHEIGYKWMPSDDDRSLRWGTNTVSDSYLDQDDPDENPLIFPSGDSGEFGTVFAFATDFDETGSDDEAQAAGGDSGAAVFAHNGSQWELVGLVSAINPLHGQPDDTAVFGDQTLITDLSPFHDQIVAITMVPEPSAVAVLGGLLVLLTRRRRR